MNERADRILTSMSKVTSFVLNPFLIPTYAIVLFLFGPTFFALIPIDIRRLIITNILLTTIVIPLIAIRLASRMGFVKDITLDTRTSRFIPLVIVLVCYSLSIYLLSGVMMVYIIKKVLIACALSVAATFVVTLYWKISLHMTAMGGFVAIVALINISHAIYTPFTLVILILLSGLLASSRLYLGKHTLGQVSAGFLCGFVVSTITMLF